MYDQLGMPAEDPILQLAQAFRQDGRENKIDLGIGIYKDADGKSAVMSAVKSAERFLIEEEPSKAYIGISGDEVFNQQMMTLVLGDALQAGRTLAVQTPGGGGAVRLLADLARVSKTNPTVWVSDRTWINHVPIFEETGLSYRRYPYFSAEPQSVDFDAMRAVLSGVKRGDIVLLHGCCHNPTGADLSFDQWKTLAASAADGGWIPFIDLAYLGFGQGLEADAEGIRHMASVVPEMMVAVSCSKNFAIYRERTGCAIVIAPSNEAARKAKANLVGLARVNWSFPPSHGAAVVRTILGSTELRPAWQAELDTMRARIEANRRELSSVLRARLNSDRFDFFATHSGMFSLSGLEHEMVGRLREVHAIFIPSDGRINVAALQQASIQRLADALAAELKEAA
ncbi:amino acid aminotransferase [Mesorhizobium sp. Cs1299R1N3]|uniref:amino acid aminotransferase n=1 Tax=Mesorhizobium sp. Cs1299R1N3 TaxID=3015173 RepID=UPI00301CD384